MHSRQPLPTLWLMTDERMGDGLLAAIHRLPAGSGLVFRHYSLAERERRHLFEQVRKTASDRQLMLLLAGSSEQAVSWGADGSHGRGPGRGLRTHPVHDLIEIKAAERAGAALLFLSPVFATRSHPGARPLGLVHFAWLARRTALPVIALGGIDPAKGRRLKAFGAYGWAGIDTWIQD